MNLSILYKLERKGKNTTQRGAI